METKKISSNFKIIEILNMHSYKVEIIVQYFQKQ